MKPEQRFWRRLAEVLPRGIYTRVENLCEPGTPDVNFCALGVEGWMELKYRDRLPMDDEHGLRVTQKLWIRRRLEHPGSAPILIAVGTRHPDLGSIVFFVDGSHFKTVNTWSLLDFDRHHCPRARLCSEIEVRRALQLAAGKDHKIYLLTFRDGHQYVGCCVQSLSRRLYLHRRLIGRKDRRLYRVWAKQGEPQVEILARTRDTEEAYHLEREAIASRRGPQLCNVDPGIPATASGLRRQRRLREAAILQGSKPA